MRHYWNSSMLDRKAKWIHTGVNKKHRRAPLGKDSENKMIRTIPWGVKGEIPKCLENKLFPS